MLHRNLSNYDVRLEVRSHKLSESTNIEHSISRRFKLHILRISEPNAKI